MGLAQKFALLVGLAINFSIGNHLLLAESENIRIINVAVFDDGSLGTGSRSGSIDVLQDLDCDNDASTVDAEKFADTVLQLGVLNNSNQSVEFDKSHYRMRLSSGLLRSRRLAFYSSGYVPKSESGQATNLLAHFFTAIDGKKYFTSQAKREIDTMTGPKNIRIIIAGHNASGVPLRLTKTINLSFADYDRCS